MYKLLYYTVHSILHLRSKSVSDSKKLYNIRTTLERERERAYATFVIGIRESIFKVFQVTR